MAGESFSRKRCIFSSRTFTHQCFRLFTHHQLLKRNRQYSILPLSTRRTKTETLLTNMKETDGSLESALNKVSLSDSNYKEERNNNDNGTTTSLVVLSHPSSPASCPLLNSDTRQKSKTHRRKGSVLSEPPFELGGKSSSFEKEQVQASSCSSFNGVKEMVNNERKNLDNFIKATKEQSFRKKVSTAYNTSKANSKTSGGSSSTASHSRKSSSISSKSSSTRDENKKYFIENQMLAIKATQRSSSSSSTMSSYSLNRHNKPLMDDQRDSLSSSNRTQKSNTSERSLSSCYKTKIRENLELQFDNRTLDSCPTQGYEVIKKGRQRACLRQRPPSSTHNNSRSFFDFLERHQKAQEQEQRDPLPTTTRRLHTEVHEHNRELCATESSGYELELVSNPSEEEGEEASHNYNNKDTEFESASTKVRWTHSTISNGNKKRVEKLRGVKKLSSQEKDRLKTFRPDLVKERKPHRDHPNSNDSSSLGQGDKRKKYNKNGNLNVLCGVPFRYTITISPDRSGRRYSSRRRSSRRRDKSPMSPPRNDTNKHRSTDFSFFGCIGGTT